MSAEVISLPDKWEMARKRVEAPSEPHIPFARCKGVVRYILVLETDWNSPRTSRSRRMSIIDALGDVAYPKDKSEIVLSPTERKMILEMRGICPGWEKPKRKAREELDNA